MAPTSFSNVMPATPQYLPENVSEIAVFNGFPTEHQGRTVIIAPRFDKTMQSGQGHVHQWTLQWKNRERWSNPLMGWTSTADPLSNVKLNFDSKEDAIAYASKNGWKFETRKDVSESTLAPQELKGYNDNYLPKKTIQKVGADGVNSDEFWNYKCNESHWFMPLKFHVYELHYYYSVFVE